MTWARTSACPERARGFVQQLATCYIARGYRYYAVRKIPERKDPRSVDAKLIDLIHSLKAGHRQGASFVMNSTTLASVRKLKTADGAFLWQPGLVEGQPDRLLGCADLRIVGGRDAVAPFICCVMGACINRNPAPGDHAPIYITFDKQRVPTGHDACKNLAFDAQIVRRCGHVPGHEMIRDLSPGIARRDLLSQKA